MTQWTSRRSRSPRHLWRQRSRRTNRPTSDNPRDRPQRATLHRLLTTVPRPDRNRRPNTVGSDGPNPDGLRGVSMEASSGSCARPWRPGQWRVFSPSSSWTVRRPGIGKLDPGSLPWFRSGLGYVVQRRPQSGRFRNCGQRQQRQLHGHQRLRSDRDSGRAIVDHLLQRRDKRLVGRSRHRCQGSGAGHSQWKHGDSDTGDGTSRRWLRAGSIELKSRTSSAPQ